MNIAEFSTDLSGQMDVALPDIARHSQAVPSLGELVTTGELQGQVSRHPS